MPSGVATIEAGRGGRPLLLVHGFTGSSFDFADQLDPLADAGFHAVALDLPGHGDSHPDGPRFGFEAFAEVVLELADELAWERFALLGHSMGGIVAQYVAFEAAHRLTHLVLMDTTPAAVQIDPALVDLACELAGDGGLEAVLVVQQSLGVSPLETTPGRQLRERPGWQEASDARFLQCSAEMYVAMARQLTTAPDRADRLADVAVPALVLVGAEDRLLLDPSDRLVAVLPDAELVVIPDAGHSPQLENPAAWLDAVVGFLR